MQSGYFDGAEGVCIFLSLVPALNLMFCFTEYLEVYCNYKYCKTIGETIWSYLMGKDIKK
jgi:hypothetical protein